MLNTNIEEALNSQYNFEMYSANIYLSMAAWADSQNLSGVANWFKVQYAEEMFHAQKFYDYIIERGGRVIVGQLDKPQSDWASPLAAFENALHHEGIVTGRVNDLMSLAIDSKDHATVAFLQWFVSEQVEEEANADAIIQKLTLMGDAPGGLFLIDNELATRVFTPPVGE
ncbi:MAG: ferritin [Phycisphaerales bacterium]|jgi:ferritin|nr:ferritin [Phycisphaerales bacterium]MBT7171253.1 ferritin [Phycisphaerales bacterium]